MDDRTLAALDASILHWEQSSGAIVRRRHVG